MIDTIINEKNIKKANAVLISAPYEHGVSFMGGTSKGPKKIVECLNQSLELYDIDFKTEPAKKIKTAHIALKGLEKLDSKSCVEKIRKESRKILDAGQAMPVLLGGEHTVSLGLLKAIAEKEKPEDITILQIDAHQDLRDDNSDYSNEKNRYAHSCVMRRAHELGFNLVQVGIRTFSKYELDYTEKNKKTIKVFYWGMDKEKPKIDQIIKSIKTKKVYISLDVDGIDPSLMPGTGTPVQGGLKWNYTLKLLRSLFEKKEIVGADIVEVAPQRDSVVTEFGSALIIYKMLAWKFKSLLS